MSDSSGEKYGVESMGVPQASTIVDAETSDEEIRGMNVRPVWRRWYRSTLFNIILLGTISLTQAGLWAALNSKFPKQPRRGLVTHPV